MKSIMIILAATVTAAATFQSAAHAERIDGIFGIKLGEKLPRYDKLGEFDSLHVKAAMVKPDNNEVLQCVALVGTNDIPLAVFCYMPWSEADAKAKVVDAWAAKYGKTSISGKDVDLKHADKEIAFDTFFSGERALSFIRQGGKVVLQCTDVTAATNMLACAEEMNDGHIREPLDLIGKVIGYKAAKQQDECKR